MDAISKTSGVDAPERQITMPQSGSQKSQRTASTSEGLSGMIPASETFGGPEAMASFDVDGNGGGSMICDIFDQENCAINAAKEPLSMAPEAPTGQIFDQIDFTGLAKHYLNSDHGERAVIGDNVQYSLLSLVKYPEEALRAASVTRTSLLEAHRDEIFSTRMEGERRVAEVQVTTKAKVGKVITRLQRASKAKSKALSRLRCVEITLTATMTELNEYKKQAHNLHTEVKGLEQVTAERNLLMAKCSKMEAQIALIEQRAALDSTSSGSYAEDRANPSILQDVACKSVDKATDALSKILHENSITKRRGSEEKLDFFLRAICPAKLGDFARPLHVKYVWSYWICSVMFRGFEHCFFDIDDGQLTSPLDAKLHASKSFECFQLRKAAPSFELYKTCDTFRAFCSRKYAELFPPDLLKAALISFCAVDNISLDECGRFSGDAQIFKTCFLDVAKAVWLLHELAFAFNPPVSILRMACGEPFDKQFHEPVVHDEGRGEGSSKVVLMIRPAFRVRNTIIRSRVFRANA